MRYSPVELRHVTLKRGLLGYRRSDVDELIADAATSFEEVWAERGEFADELEELHSSLAEVKQRETLLATTLVAAEKAAAEAVEAAKRQAEVIIAEAHQEGRSITRAALAERDRLFAETRRIEALLRAALGIVVETREGSKDDAEPESWPRHEDTSEFQMVVETPGGAEPAPVTDDKGPGFNWG
jgi:cell division septum initiation protein DivIVA